MRAKETEQVAFLFTAVNQCNHPLGGRVPSSGQDRVHQQRQVLETCFEKMNRGEGEWSYLWQAA
jgi:hypothetical protein